MSKIHPFNCLILRSFANVKFGYIYLIGLLAALNLATPALAQYDSHCLEIEWAYNYGGSDQEWIRSVTETPDKGYIFVGYSKSANMQVGDNAGNWDVWVAKLDSLGIIEWTQVLGGSGSDEISSIELTADGGYILAGSSTSSDGSLTGNNGSEDAWIIKLNQQGAVEWQHNFGGLRADKAEAVRSTADGGFIVCGYSESSGGDVGGNNGDFDMWVFKIDAGGQILWSRNYGGSLDDWAFALDVTLDGGYILAGSSFSSDGDVSANNGFYDFWVVKLDASGTMQWESNMGGTSEERAYAIRQAADGSYIVSGTAFSADGDVSSNAGGSDVWLVKLNAVGQIQWERNYGGTGEEYARALQIRDNGNYAILSYSFSTDGDITNNQGIYDFWILETDPNGNLIWQHTYGGSGTERAFTLGLTSDHGYILGGYSLSNDGDVADNFGDWDCWLVKLHPEPIVLELGHDTTLCTGQTAILDVGMSNAPDFSWQDGQSGPTYTVSNPGIYWVEGSRGACKERDSVVVSYVNADVLDLGQDILECASSGPVTLDATLPNADGYLWSNGHTEPTLTIHTTELYSVEVMQYGCLVTDEIQVVFAEPYAELGPDTCICEGDYLIPEMWQPEAVFLWQDGWDGHNFLIRDTGAYWVEVNIDGCLARDTFHVSWCEKFRDPCLEFPNAFTPNDDAVNEVFKPVNFCRANSYQLRVFNRWGEQVFASNDPDIGWRGDYKGKPARQGVYIYMAEFTFTFEGQQIQQQTKGEVLLLR